MRAERGERMKPKRKTVKVEVVYWECNVSEHRHKTYEAALNCMAIRKNTVKGDKKWTELNLKTVLEQRRQGMTYREIGDRWGGLSVTRVGQIVRQAERMEAKSRRND